MVIHFSEMSVHVPTKDGETAEDIENRLIDAVYSIGDHVTMSYQLNVEDDQGELTDGGYVVVGEKLE